MKIWLWNGAALAIVASFAIAGPRVFDHPERSRMAPYRYDPTTAAESDAELAFHQERVDRAPEGLDLAALAGAYLRKARRTGQSRWIDEARASARRSLE